jgi:hypothetical protein
MVERHCGNGAADFLAEVPDLGGSRRIRSGSWRQTRRRVFSS